MSTEDYDYDIIIIGGGSAGLACAKKSKSLGAKVAVIDYVKPSPKGSKWGMGGTCINVGCIPKKIMHHVGLLADDVQEAVSYGWEQIPSRSRIVLDWQQLIQQIEYLTKSTNWILKVEMRTQRIDYHNGIGSFLTDHDVKIQFPNGTEKIKSGKYILISGGCRPSYPPIPGAIEYGITTDDLFTLPKAPGNILLVGGSYISMECSCFLRSFGFETTVMVRDIILRKFDREISDIIKSYLEQTGVKFLMKCVPLEVTKRPDNRLSVKYLNTNTKVESIQTFDTVLWATGRKPLLEELNLDAVGVAVKDGFILADDSDCTNVPNIFALGDIVKDRIQLTPPAISSGKLLADRLFAESDIKMNYNAIPSTLFTGLEYSFVGMTEESALQLYGEEKIEVYHGFYMPMEYFIPSKSGDYCFIKIIAKREGDQLVLGMHFTGPNAGEVIQGFAVAINCGLTMIILFNTVGVNVTNAQQITKTTVTKRSGLDAFKEFNCI